MSTTASGHDHWQWGLLAAIVVATAAVGTYLQLRPDPPERRPIKDFLLTEHGGTMLSKQRLSGQVWVASFFFIRCTESCPKLVEALTRLHGELAGSKVRLVSFSADPAHDSVDRLRAFAAAQGADAQRWWFVTGAKDQVRALAEKSFLVNLVDTPEAPIGQHVTHSNRLFVVDREGQVIGEGIEVVRRASIDGPFEIDERALRRVFLRALDEDQGRPLGLADLPLVNATLNGTAAVLLLIGWGFIRAGWYQAHGVTMSLAFAASSLFLASYLYYHAFVGDTKFVGPPAWRTFYLVLLASHVILAIVTVPLVLLALWKAARRQWQGHRRYARWTLPIWLYVSVTGIAVYLLLYRLFDL
jgi:uncharacterized membrane protein YozB (DUF420 family)/cytochrome oxidase Cu insertion factor (SCO1/SenC/PrrC family)